jgi:hypothetical protein
MGRVQTTPKTTPSNSESTFSPSAWDRAEHHFTATVEGREVPKPGQLEFFKSSNLDLPSIM